MRLFLAIPALVGLLASGIGCVASPDGSESESEAPPGVASEALSPSTANKSTSSSPGHCIETVFCINGKHWDSNLCRCVGPVCDPIACPSGEVWDSTTCSCEKPVCDPRLCVIGKFWDPQTCSCECVDIVDCINGTHWDPKTCSCEGPTTSNP
jgi:hypothetical protein